MAQKAAQYQTSFLPIRYSSGDSFNCYACVPDPRRKPFANRCVDSGRKTTSMRPGRGLRGRGHVSDKLRTSVQRFRESVLNLRTQLGNLAEGETAICLLWDFFRLCDIGLSGRRGVSRFMCSRVLSIQIITKKVNPFTSRATFKP